MCVRPSVCLSVRPSVRMFAVCPCVTVCYIQLLVVLQERLKLHLPPFTVPVQQESIKMSQPAIRTTEGGPQGGGLHLRGSPGGPGDSPG